MTKYIFIVIALTFFSLSKAQVVTVSTESLTKKTSEALSYSNEEAEEGSFEIVKNTLGEELSSEIKIEINKRRKETEDFLWVVNENLEIRIHPITK